MVFPRLFNPTYTRTDHHVDAYFVQLNDCAPEPLIRQSTYWHSLWSHRRSGRWKGYLEVDLSVAADTTAMVNLERLKQKGEES